MIVDGRAIAEDLYNKARERTRKCNHVPVLTIFVCAPNFETKKYLALKERKAKGIGVTTHVVELGASSTTSDFLSAIAEAISHSDGIIVQFPLPTSVDNDVVVRSIPSELDVDGLNPENTLIHTPVVDACREILARNNVVVEEKFVTVIGSGRLVGLPAYLWFVEQGAHVSVVTRDTSDISHYTKNADIIVCGAGSPGLIKPDMVREGVIILDAGTSEEGGELRGDADSLCAGKASLFTPVPGGIGPITVAILLSNVVLCAEKKSHVV